MKTELGHEHWSYLLPWYANGTLTPEEHVQVEGHLKTCAVCQREVHWLQNVSISMAALPEEVPDASATFAKTMTAIDQLETSRSPFRSNWFAGFFRMFWNPPVPVARLVFAAQLAVIVGLGLYSLRPQKAGPGFFTLSGSEASTGGVRLTINFAPDATVKQMNESLIAVGGRIVSGPSASGMYVVELPIGAEKETEIQAVIDKLRANKPIRFVERQP
jgi:hypothetical protein